MLGLIARLAAVVLFGSTFTVALGSAASASGGDCPGPVGPGGICLSDEDPTDEGADDEDGDPGSATPVGTQGAATIGCRDGSGKVIPCTDSNGFSWMDLPMGHNARNAQSGGCYGFALEPQPEPGSPLWEGNDPSEGSIWSCDPTVSVQENSWFVPNGDQAAQQIVDAAGIAESMLARAPFEVADLRMAPPYDFHTYIRIENWFWVPEGQWHEVSLTEDVGPASVTLTATPSQLVVDTGNSPPAPARCYDAGRPWVKGMSDAAQTTCSYAYETIQDPEGDTYSVTGQLFYEVSWTCTGRCSTPAGDLGEYPAPESEPHQVEVRQRQTVVTGQ